MEKEEKKRKERKSTATIRKASKKGEVTQKMMSFRVDADVARALEGTPNKGRLLNELVRKHYGLQTP